MANNYVLGRGKLYFARFDSSGAPGPKRYIGNTPQVGFTISTDEFTHYNSDAGVREKDASFTLQTNRTGSFTTDNVHPENLALFFFGTVSAISQTAATVADEPINSVVKGSGYRLGTGTNDPIGKRDLAQYTSGSVNIIVKKGSTPLTEGVDYEINMRTGMLLILEDGTALSNGDNITVSYKTKAVTRSRILSGNNAIEGELWYEADNPGAKNASFYAPYVKLTPNGDFQLKAESDIQALQFNIELLKKSSLNALYIDGEGIA